MVTPNRDHIKQYRDGALAPVPRPN
jgi:hypothetical protein